MARLQSGTRSVRLESIATPTADTDAANKAYVDDHSLDLESNGTLLTRRPVANFDPVFTLTDDTSDANNPRTNIDITDGAINTIHIANNAIRTGKIQDLQVTTSKLAEDAVTNAKLADNAVQLENMADDSVGASELVDNSVGADALNVSGDGTQHQLLESDGDGSFTWVNPELDTLSDVTISSPASEHMLSYGPGGQWVNSQVLQVDDVSGVPTLTHVFGRRLVTAIPFQSFSFNTNSSVSPRGALFWDEPLTSVTFNNVNNPAFDDEYANRITAANVNGTTLTTFPSNTDATKAATFTRTFTPSNVDSTINLAKDIRTGAYTGAAGGTRQLNATISTNLDTTTTVGQSWSWRAGGFVSHNSSPGSLRFDATNDDYRVTLVVQPSADGAANISNVGLTSPSVGTAPALQAGVAGSQYNITVTNGVTIYHDTSVTGGYTGTFTRPSTVSDETAGNRAHTDTGSFTVAAPTTLYPVWSIRAANTVVFDTTTPTNSLGALSSNGYAATGVTGHTIATVRSADSSTTAWKGQTYGFDNSSGAAMVFILVVPSTATFTQPLSLNAAANPVHRTVSLGHADHTVSYNVYEFQVAAGSNFQVQPA